MFNNLKQDIPAGIVVFFVALPLCLGIALASGAPLFSGIIAGIIGGIVVGLLSGSQLGVSGPAAGLAVIVLNAITEFGMFEIFLVSVVIGGALQIVLGMLKAGVIAYYFPSAVIKGMLAAIGIIIILKQIPHAVGYDADYEGDMNFFQSDGDNTLTSLSTMLDFISPGVLLVSILSLCLMIVWDNILLKKLPALKPFPGPLLVVVLGILYTMMIPSSHSLGISADHMVNVPIPEDFSSFFGQFTFPDFSYLLNYDVWVVGVTIAIVASLETLLCVDATDKLDPHKRVTPTNRELIAQGTGNMLSGFIGGLPITQVIVRSSANIQNGGKTKMAAVFHGILLILAVTLIPGILNKIPLGVLAAILLIVGYKLAKPALFKEMYKLGKDQFIPFIITVIGVVFTDLLVGIALGFAVAVIGILIKNYRNSHFLHITELSNGIQKVRMEFAEEVSFLNKGAIQRELSELPNNITLELDVRKVIRLNYDILEVLEEFLSQAKDKAIQVHLISERGDFHNPESFMLMFLKSKVE